MNLPIRWALLVLGVMGMTGPGLAQDVNIRRISHHVITLSMSNLGMHTNVTVVETRKGLVVIETEITPYIMSQIKTAAEQKLGRNDWAYVINTHAHLHHAAGNVLFKEAQIVGHVSMSMDWLQKRLSTPEGRKQYCRTVGVTDAIRQLQQTLAQTFLSTSQTTEFQRRLNFCYAVEKEIMSGFEVVNPTVTFEDRMTLDLGDVHLRLIYWGDGINHSSIFVQVVEDKLLVGVGMGKNGMPDFYGRLSIEGLRRAISITREVSDENFPVDRMIGVHLPELITGKQHFQKRQLYLQTLLSDLTQSQQQGLTLEQVKDMFSLSKRHASLAGLFTMPENLEAQHQKNIEKIWTLLQSHGPQ